MSKADKMFLKLGYEKADYDEVEIYVSNCGDVNFDIGRKWYEVDESICAISIDLHLAIHEKIKELGWINE